MIGRHDLDLFAIRQLHHVGVVAAKVSNLQNFAGEYVSKLAIWFLLADVDLLRSHRYRNRLTDIACGRVINVDDALWCFDLASVRCLNSQLAIKQICLTNKVSNKPTIGVLVNFVRRTHLQDTPMAHHRDTRGHRHRLFLVMRHHDTGHTDRLNNIDQLELRFLA